MDDEQAQPQEHAFDDIDLSGARARRIVLRDALVREVDLSGAVADQVRLRGAHASGVDLTGLRLTEVLLDDVVVRGAFIEGPVEISGDVEGLVVNGVEVAPLVEAELARRYPDYAAMKPTDADGFRHAWDVVEELWAGTVERARGFGPEQLHESVDGEWSFVETLRHLVFVNDVWVGRTIEGREDANHPWGLPPDHVPREAVAALGITVDAQPSVDEVLGVLEERGKQLGRVLGAITPEDLSRRCVVPQGEVEVLGALQIVQYEGLSHHEFATRDLAVLEAADPT